MMTGRAQMAQDLGKSDDADYFYGDRKIIKTYTIPKRDLCA